MHDINDKTHDTTMNATPDLVDDLENLKSKVRETGEAIAQAAIHAKDNAEKLLKSSVKDMRNTSEELQENLVTYIQENPLKSIGIAALIGLIAAAALT